MGSPRTTQSGQSPRSIWDRNCKRQNCLLDQTGGCNVSSRCRWLMLGILSLDICVSYLPYYTFVPILRQSMQVYGVDDAALNWCCILYALVYVPGAFLTGPVITAVGSRGAFVLAMALTTAGCVVRCGPQGVVSMSPNFGMAWNKTSPPTLDVSGMSNNSIPHVGVTITEALVVVPTTMSFWWLLVGQALCAIGQPFLVNCTSEMGAEWFPPHERPTAAMVSNLMNFIGSSLSFMIPAMIVEEYPDSLETAERQITCLLQFQFYISLLSFVLTFAFYRSAPASHMLSEHRVNESFFSEALKVLMLRDFWLINIQFAIYVAIGHAFDAVEGSLLEHYGYSAALTSWTGASCAVGAVLSTIVESRCITDASSYRLALFIANGLLLASQLLGFFCLYFQMSGTVFIVAIGVMGLSTPGWGCSCELASEVCFPAHEATVCSLLEMFSNLLGVVAIIITQNLLDNGIGVGVLLYMGIGSFLGGSLLFGLSGRLLRTEAETENEAGQKEEVEMIDVSNIDLKRPNAQSEKSIASAPWDCTSTRTKRKVKPLKRVCVSCLLPMLPKNTAKKRTKVVLAVAGCLFAAIVCLAPFIKFFKFGSQLTLQSGQAKGPYNLSMQKEIQILESQSHMSPLGQDLIVDSVGAAQDEHISTTALYGEGHMEVADMETPAPKPFNLAGLHSLANGLTEPYNFVINCEKDTKKLNRFRKYMQKANLTFETFPCEKGTYRHIKKAVRAGLITETALEATEGVTRGGLSRATLIGRAVTHLKLMRTIVEGDIHTANIFEDDEVVYSRFHHSRDTLLAELPSNLDFVNLNVRLYPAGDKVKFRHAKGKKTSTLQKMKGKVFQMKSGLSPFTNEGMGNYVVSKRGAEQILHLLYEYDTFGKWEILDNYLLSEMYDEENMKSFLGFAVAPNMLSIHCGKFSGHTRNKHSKPVEAEHHAMCHKGKDKQ